MTAEQRIEFIQRLIASGVIHLEIASFMRDDLVPSMAGAEQVVAGIPAQSGLTRAGLVANTKGAQRALACGLDEVTITVSLSDTYSQKNTGKSCHDVGLHLHETRGTGLVNAMSGLEAGVRRFDYSLGGIGGSPFADGAAGNVVTETLVFLLHDMGYKTPTHREVEND